jgi:hypothetical protein
MLQANLTKSWTTHMGVLVKVLLISSGDVVELGAGPFSTPLLHWVCKSMNRRLITYENNPEFYNYARQFRSRLHRIVFVKNWDEVDASTHRGLVFIDHAPATRRGTDVIRFKDSADYIVMHDTNSEKDYTNVWEHFKDTYTWKECRPWVSVVSNFKNLSKLG